MHIGHNFRVLSLIACFVLLFTCCQTQPPLVFSFEKVTLNSRGPNDDGNVQFFVKVVNNSGREVVIDSTTNGWRVDNDKFILISDALRTGAASIEPSGGSKEITLKKGETRTLVLLKSVIELKSYLTTNEDKVVVYQDIINFCKSMEYNLVYISLGMSKTTFVSKSPGFKVELFNSTD